MTLFCQSAEYAVYDVIATCTHEGKGFLGSSFDAFEEPVADHSVTSMQTDPDVLLGEIEDVRCL